LKLAEELKAINEALDPEQFLAGMKKAFEDNYPNFSVEDLLCRWRESSHFCAVIRSKFGVPDTADEFILRTLLNTRKKGELSIRERVA
jgi:hypothetical protein